MLLCGVLLMLLGTAAPALARMTCVNSGHTVVQMGTTGDCCPHDEHDAGPTVQATCCEVLTTEPQHSVFLGHLPISCPTPAIVPVEVKLVLADAFPVPVERTGPFARPPPEVLGRRLATIGRLLI